MAEQQHVAGIDRHPEMVDRAARRLDSRRDHVAPVDNDRGAVHQNEVGARRRCRGNARRQIGGRVIAALLGGKRGTKRGKPLLRYLARLVEDAFLQPRQPGLDQRDPARHKRRHLQQLPALRRELGGGGNRLFRHRERDDLDRRDHLARFDDRERRQRAERHRPRVVRGRVLVRAAEDDR